MRVNQQSNQHPHYADNGHKCCGVFCPSLRRRLGQRVSGSTILEFQLLIKPGNFLLFYIRSKLKVSVAPTMGSNGHGWVWKKLQAFFLFVGSLVDAVLAH